MSTLLFRSIKVHRFPLREQSGRFSVSQDPVEFTIEGSLQPVGGRDREVAPPGTFDYQDRMLFVKGDVNLDIGDIVFEDDATRFKIHSIQSDWRTIANYAKYRLRQVKE